MSTKLAAITVTREVEYNVLKFIIESQLGLQGFPNEFYNGLVVILIKRIGGEICVSWDEIKDKEYNQLSFQEGVNFLLNQLPPSERDSTQVRMNNVQLTLSGDGVLIERLDDYGTFFSFDEMDWILEETESFRDLNLL